MMDGYHGFDSGHNSLKQVQQDEHGIRQSGEINGNHGNYYIGRIINRQVNHQNNLFHIISINSATIVRLISETDYEM